MKKFVFFVIVLIIFLAGIPFGMLNAEHKVIYESGNTYIKQVHLDEDVVLDDKNVISKFGDAIILSKGTEGRIRDSISYWGDELGYELIYADFALEDGKSIDVAISINPVDDNNSMTEISIESIADSAEILSGYEVSREQYHEQVKAFRRNGMIIGIAISTIIPVISVIAYYNLNKKGNNMHFLLLLDASIAIILVGRILFELFWLTV